MSNNALAVLQKKELRLSEVERMILEEAAADDTAFDVIPTKIKISPGGINAFATSDGEVMKNITAIVAVSQMARAYWPEKGTGQPPLCASLDSRRGVFDHLASDERLRAATGALNPHPAIPLIDAKCPIPDTFACVTCPLNDWGSTHQNGPGRGKACKELRRLVVIVDGWAAPALLTLPPTSLESWDTYCNGLARQKSAYWAVRTKITLSEQQRKGGGNEPYSVAAFTVDSQLADAVQINAVIALRAEYKRLVGEMSIDSAEYDTTDANGDGATSGVVDGVSNEELDTLPF